MMIKPNQNLSMFHIFQQGTTTHFDFSSSFPLSLGAVATEVANGPSIARYVKWGRTDAPRIFCTGELQLTMPDATGGHKEGSNMFGSSNVQSRLQTVFNQTRTYFEEQLELMPEDWIAYLAGGHSIGGE